MVEVPVDHKAFGTKLYVRLAYIKLWDTLQQRRRSNPRYKGAVISGNPGIGKSFFAYYCALR